MGEWDALARTSAAEDIATVATVMLAVGEGEGSAASHADIGIGPFWGCAAVEHATGNVLFGRELIAFSLEAAIDVVDVAQGEAALCCSGPRLDELEHLVLDIGVGRHGWRCFQQRRHVVEELARSYLLDEVGAAILDARVGEVEGRKLDVWVLVPYPALQGSHGIFRLHCLGSNHIGYLEVERHVL